MEAQELRQLSVEELKGRVNQFKEDLVRARFKVQSAEERDTSLFKRLDVMLLELRLFFLKN